MNPHLATREGYSPLLDCAAVTNRYADADRLLELRLVASDDLALESREEDHVIVVNTASATRTRLSLATYQFLMAFQHPGRIREIVSADAAFRVLPHVRVLIDKCMLIDVDAGLPAVTPRVRTAVAYRFCGAPVHDAATQPDFVILGVPYDLAGEGDCRSAPALIRRKSFDYGYQLDLAEGRPRGWFDADRGGWILRGARIADAGDVFVDYGESEDCSFDRVGAALGQCCPKRCVPVVLGGDRSVTRAVIGALCFDDQLTVVQITRNPDRAAEEGGGRRLLGMTRVERVVSIGAVADDAGERSGDSMRWTASMLREYGADAIIRSWGERRSIYLSIDLDLATAAYMTAMSGGSPFGATLHELKSLIAAIGHAHRIVSIDLVGLDMQSGSPALSAIVGCQLALAAMSAAHDD